MGEMDIYVTIKKKLECIKYGLNFKLGKLKLQNGSVILMAQRPPHLRQSVLWGCISLIRVWGLMKELKVWPIKMSAWKSKRGGNYRSLKDKWNKTEMVIEELDYLGFDVPELIIN